MTLTDFLLARVAEDEAEARAADARPYEPQWWDPQRVLAECEAKRQIIALHDLDGADNECLTCRSAGYPCDTLRLLALLCTDHPEYRDEWRPV